MEMARPGLAAERDGLVESVMQLRRDGFVKYARRWMDGSVWDPSIRGHSSEPPDGGRIEPSLPVWGGSTSRWTQRFKTYFVNPFRGWGTDLRPYLGFLLLTAQGHSPRW